MDISGIRGDALARNVPHESRERPGLLVPRTRGARVEPEAARASIASKDQLAAVVMLPRLSGITLRHIPIAPVVASTAAAGKVTCLHEH